MSPTPSSNAFLASLVNSSSDAILSKDLKGVITSWNRGAERLFGYTAAEAIGQPITLIFPPERVDEEPAILARIMRGEQIEHYETVRRRKDGAYIDISLTVSPIIDEQGNVIGASKVARDITEQRREQERLSVTLSSIGDAVISTDETGNIAFINTAAANLTGWTTNEALGRPLTDVLRIIDETPGRTLESPLARVAAAGAPIRLAHHAILSTRDGAPSPIDANASPIRSRSGRFLGMVLVFRDATERRNADLNARRLAAIVEGSDDAIIAKDLKGIVQTWNPGAERIFGYTSDEMVGKPITLLLPPGRLTEEQQILARLQRGERVDHFNTFRLRKNGEQFPVSLTISPIHDSNGRVVGASKIARDITALRRAQERLEAHAAELEHKVRERTAKLEATVGELEAFSYSLSHDMRAPLRAIHSFAEIVLADYTDEKSASVEYLRKIISAAGRMDRLIQDVLSFARLSRTQIEVRSLDVDRLVHDLIHERPELHTPKGIVTVESPLLRVMGHDASLIQCLANLLNNAVKFVAPGVTPKVTVSTRAIGDRVRICVCDNGIGIDPAAQRRLFSMFQRLQPAESFEGTGVGLAIVKKAAERMNGTVGVDSAEEQGSTFWVELPRG